MKKFLLKFSVCLVIFFLTIFVSGKIYNKGNEEKTTTMTSVSLPVVELSIDGFNYNTLYGMKQDMKECFIRDTITPLGENRSLSFVIDKYGNDISNIAFEVRSIDGTRLVEQTKISNFTENKDQIKATINIKDLIEINKEYNWILVLEVGDEKIRYYTRIVDNQNYNLPQMLSFVTDFHKKTYMDEEARDLVTYLESNSKGDNTTYNKVDIHCSLKQVTWGDLRVKELMSPKIFVSDIDKNVASIRLKYIVETLENKNRFNYNVDEYFKIKYTPDRMYLLDYERKMEQIFSPQANVYASNKIMLGIRSPQVQMMESEGGSNLAFVDKNQLFCYHASDKKMATLFSFYEDSSRGGYDIRSIYDSHDIKILSIDETGNVKFIVYGYMNRGSHEGNIGIVVYEYNGMLNTVEEMVFIPCNKSFAALKADIEELSYINKNNIFYFYLDGSIISVDLNVHSFEELASGLQQDSFKVSDSDKMLVWQNTADAYDCTGLNLVNLNTGKKQEIIKNLEDDRLLPLGFINEDLIYGVARYEDIVTDSTGTITFPMYCVYIQNEAGDILKTYQHDGKYVTSARVEDNLITISRVEKSSDEKGYVKILDDQIVNNIVEKSGYNSFETVVTEHYLKIVQLAVRNTIEVKNLKYTIPKMVLFEGSRQMDIVINDPVDRYYVYGRDGVTGTYSHVAEAINNAYAVGGCVVDQSGNYVWRKTSRSTRNQIMAITAKKSESTSSDLATCVETILEYNGSVKNVQPMLDSGQTVKNIFSECLEDSTVLDLQGVSLDAILYYVNMDIPVLATLKDSTAVLVIGFNDLNIVVMDPSDGTIYKKGINDSAEWFNSNGNEFMVCIR